MIRYTFVLIIAQLILSSVAMAQETETGMPVAEIDLEVVELLSLNDEQAVAYSAIMQRQRAVYQSLKPRRWAQQKAFYDQTFARLKPVLTDEQHVRFVAYMDSFIEAIPEEELVAME